MNEDSEKFIKRWRQYKESHIKSIDTNMFHWFQSFGLPAIKEFCDTDQSIEWNYKIIENGITVDITSSSLLLSELDTDMLQVMQSTDTTFIESNKNGTFTITLWFRGWKWSKKEM